MSDGGPALASIRYTMPACPFVVQDMSLRDYFAGQALAGVVGAQNMHCAFNEVADEDGEEVSKVTVDFCYAIADAMLKAREET